MYEVEEAIDSLYHDIVTDYEDRGSIPLDMEVVPYERYMDLEALKGYYADDIFDPLNVAPTLFVGLSLPFRGKSHEGVSRPMKKSHVTYDTLFSDAYAFQTLERVDADKLNNTDVPNLLADRISECKKDFEVGDKTYPMFPFFDAQTKLTGTAFSPPVVGDVQWKDLTGGWLFESNHVDFDSTTFALGVLDELEDYVEFDEELNELKETDYSGLYNHFRAGSGTGVDPNCDLNKISDIWEDMVITFPGVEKRYGEIGVNAQMAINGREEVKPFLRRVVETETFEPDHYISYSPPYSIGLLSRALEDENLQDHFAEYLSDLEKKETNFADEVSMLEIASNTNLMEEYDAEEKANYIADIVLEDNVPSYEFFKAIVPLDNFHGSETATKISTLSALQSYRES